MTDTPLRFSQVSKSFARGKDRVQALINLDLHLSPAPSPASWDPTAPARPR